MNLLLKDPDDNLTIDQSIRTLFGPPLNRQWAVRPFKRPGANPSIEPLLTGSITCLKQPGPDPKHVDRCVCCIQCRLLSKRHTVKRGTHKGTHTRHDTEPETQISNSDHMLRFAVSEASQVGAGRSPPTLR
jgi:hypothetical protein